MENKRLGAVLAAIQLEQGRRDEARLALPKVTIRQKDRIGASRPSPVAPANQDEKRRRGRPAKNASAPTPRIVLAGIDPHGPVQAYFDRFAVEQAERRRRNNDKTNEQKRQREFAAIKARIPG